MDEFEKVTTKIEINDKKQKTSNNGLSTQLGKNEIRMNDKIKDIMGFANSKNIETMSFVTVQMRKIQTSQNNLENDVRKMHDEVDDKLHKINETEQIMAMVRNEIQNEIDTQVKELISKSSEELKEYIGLKQHVKGIIGEEDMSYESWVINTHNAVINAPSLIEAKFEETRQIIQELQEQNEEDELKRDKVTIIFINLPKINILFTFILIYYL
jgi:hypothetical protein